MKIENIEKVKEILERIQWLEMDKRCLKEALVKNPEKITSVTFHTIPSSISFTIPVSVGFSKRLLGFEESSLDEEIKALKKELESL
jgi:hypothetical protein